MLTQQILLDMDGCVADYLTPSLKLFGFDPANYPPGQWNVWEALGISQSDYVGTVDRQPDFWRDIKPFPWKNGLVRLLDAWRVPWCVVTSPWVFLHPTLHSDKVAWVRKHIGPHVKCHLCDEKTLMARSSTLLIDDGEHNVDAFAAAGGQTILFPQLWNRRGHSRDPLADVAADLTRLLTVRGAD